MKNKDNGSTPIPDDADFRRELGEVTRGIRAKHFLGVLSGSVPSCVYCGEPAFNSQAFCTNCGKKNSSYDEAQFELENDATVGDIKAEEGCPGTHHVLRQALRDDAELKSLKGKTYCAECGALVDINK